MTLRKCSLIGLIISLVASFLALQFGCNSGGGGGGPQPASITSVTATCTLAQVQVGQTSQCSAKVQGTGNFSPAVTWSVQGGSANGTINQNGLYTAPDPVPNPPTATVTAVSQQDASKSGSTPLSLLYPAPVVTAATPSAVVVGSGDTMVTFSGSGFTHASAASFNGVQLSTSFSSFTQLTATIPATDLTTAGTDKLTVSNPAPGGGVSPPITFAVNNPVPTLASVAPTSVLVGSGDQVVTAAGTNFVQGAVVDFNSISLATTFVSATQLTALLPGADLLSAGINNVTVVNPSPGGGASPPLKFEVDNPVPVVTSISPPSTPAGSSGSTLTINGSNFVSTSTVTFNGAPHSATFVSSSQITMTLMATDQAKPGAYQVVVTNPSPGGGTSQPILFSVYFPPSSTGSTAVLVETIPVSANSTAAIKTRSLSAATGPTVMKTVDVAYVPMPSVGQVVALNLDAAPTTGSNQITGAVVATIAMPTGYTPNFTAADAADNVVLVGSYSSNVIVEISIPPLDPTHPKVMGSYSLDAGSGTQFSGGKCIVCGLVVDDRPNRHYAIASTSNGYLIFNPLNGTSAVEGSFNVPPSENFAYDPILQSVMNPNYQCFLFCGGGSLQVLDLKTMGVINSITDFVGSAPDSAAADPQTHLAAVPDEFNSTVYLLNFTGTSLGPVAAGSINQRLTTGATQRPVDSSLVSRAPMSTNAVSASAQDFVLSGSRRDDEAKGAASSKLPAYDPATLRAEREAWFMHGRQSTDGISPAEHRLRAIEQRELIPLLDRSSFSATTTTRGAALSLATSTPWLELGPEPLDTSGSTDGTGSACGNGVGQPCQDYGKVSGRATSIAVDLAADPQGNTVYVGTAYGGVWRSTNGLSTSTSSTFVPISDATHSLAVGALAVHSSGTTINLYVGTGESNNSGDSYYGVGILLVTSTDNGNSWAPPTLISSADGGAHPFFGLAFSKILVDPNPNLLVAAAVDSTCCVTGLSSSRTPGIYRSTDGGNSWSLVTSGLPPGASCTDLVYDPTPTQPVYYAAIRGSGVYKSTDGASWALLQNSPQGFFRASLATRGGALWTLMSDRAGNPFGPGLSQTTDGGQMWTNLPLPPSLFCSSAGCQGWYDQSIAAPPAPSTGLVVGGLDVWSVASLSNISSTSWVNLTNAYSASSGLVHSDQHAIGVVDASHWYVGNDGGVWATTNSGSSWIDLNSTIGTIQFVSVSADPTNAGLYIGGAQDNGTSASQQTGKTWKRFYVGDGGYTATSPNGTYFGEYVHVNLLRFDDMGSNPDNDSDSSGALDTDNDPSLVVGASTTTDFFTYHDNSAFYVPYQLVPSNSSMVVLGTCRVWEGPAQPSSPGAGWTKISPDLTLADSGLFTCDKSPGPYIQVIAVAPSSPDFIYAGTSNGLVQSTSNATCSTTSNPSCTMPDWNQIFADAFNRPIGAITVHPLDKKSVYIGIQGFGNGGTENSGGMHVLMSKDAGQHWTDITGNLPDAPVNWIQIDPDPQRLDKIYVANDVGVFVATDGGAGGNSESWEQLGAGLPSVPVMQFAMTAPKLGPRQIVAATHGRGAWQIPPIPGSPDFSLSANPTTATVNAGDPAALNLISFGFYGDLAPINLSCVTPTGGCNFSPNPAPPGSTVLLTITPGALALGTNAVTISGSDGTNTHQVNATVSVQDFSLTVTPASGSVPAGQSAVFDVGLLSGTGYDNPVSLNCSVSPPTINIGCLFAPLSINSANPVAQLTVFAGTMVGSFTITVTGTNGNLSHTATLNLTVNPPPTPTSLTVPSSSFQVGPGVTTCQQLGDWTMVAVELNSHALMVGQEFADCIAVAQLPASPVIDATGHPVAPPPPTALRFGEVPKDPDANIWNNGGDPHGIAVFTSVVDGKAYGFVVEGSPGPFDPNGSPGGSPAWVARISLSDFLAATANTSTGEVDPATMAKLITFIGTK